MMNTKSVVADQINTALCEWVKNSSVAGIVRDPSRFITYTGINQIDVDYNQFPEPYVYKYISDDMEKYSLKLLRSIEKAMFATLAKIAIQDYTFHFNFKYYGKMHGKTVTYYLLTRMR